MNNIKYKLLLLSLMTFLSMTLAAQPFRSGITNPQDPNLDPNWSWHTDRNPQVMYYNVQNRVQKINKVVYLPFFSSGHDLCHPTKKDMYPEDGWMLFCKDFGTPTRAPEMPFFILYNKYRGILRVLFYNAQQINYSLFKADLSFVTSSQSAAILTFSDNVKPFLYDYDPNKSDIVLGEIAKFGGWGYADFSLFGYDPRLNKNAIMRLTVHGVNESVIKLNSTEFTLNQILDLGNQSGSNNTGNFKDALNEGVKYYKNVDKLEKGLKNEIKAIDKKGGKKPWYYNGLEAVANVASGNIVGAVAGVLGFVKSLFFTKDETPKPMKFEGSIKFEGTITNNELLFATDFILNNNASLSIEYNKPVQDIPIGVFNLANNINLYYAESKTKNVTREYYSLLKPNSHSSADELKYVFNENSGLIMTSMKAAFVYEDYEPTELYMPQLFNKMSFEHKRENKESTRIPNGVALELKFQAKGTINMNEEITVYKVYPTNLKKVDDWSDFWWSYVVIGDPDLNFDFFGGGKYNIAINNIYIKNGFTINSADISLTPFVHFIAGNQVRINPNVKITGNQNKNISFKCADHNSLQLSPSTAGNPNFVESMLIDIEPEIFDDLDFRNLQIHYEISDEDNAPTPIENVIINKGFEVSVFPNPTDDRVEFNVESSESKAVSLFLYDESGRNVFVNEYNIIEGDNKISISLIEAGFSGSNIILYKVADKKLNSQSGKIIKK